MKTLDLDKIATGEPATTAERAAFARKFLADYAAYQNRLELEMAASHIKTMNSIEALYAAD